VTPRDVLRAPVVASIAAALALAPAPAIADMTKDQCIDADTQAQSLRRQGKLASPRAQLQRCGDPACPALLRDDCTRLTDELERAQPTILFDAKDGAGHDLGAVRVTMDGQPLADALGGTALRVDPGAHVFTFTTAGQAPVELTFVIKEGEKERRERVVIGAPPSAPAVAPGPATPAASPPPTVLPTTPPETTDRGMGGRRILGLVVAGAGVAGVAVGGAFGLLTASAANQQKTDCASPTSCAHYPQAASDHSTAVTDGTVSTVGFIAGGVLLVGGAVLFLTGGHASEASTSTGLVVAPSAAPGGGGLWLRGSF
jgi:hypothetical protein